VRAPRRENLAAALGRHARAKSVPAFAHQFARLIGPFHGIFSAARLSIDAVFSRRRAIGAAYTKALPNRQCDAAAGFSSRLPWQPDV
jgi:hypothetical protein